MKITYDLDYIYTLLFEISEKDKFFKDKKLFSSLHFNHDGEVDGVTVETEESLPKVDDL